MLSVKQMASSATITGLARIFSMTMVENADWDEQ